MTDAPEQIWVMWETTDNRWYREQWWMETGAHQGSTPYVPRDIHREVMAERDRLRAALHSYVGTAFEDIAIKALKGETE